MTPSPAYDLDALRSEIPLLERFVPMNNCSQAPQTTATRRAAEAYLDSWDRDGMDWERWLVEVEAARAEFARLIGAEPEEVAVGTSVSQLTAAVASALDFRAGRRKVLVTEAEFPTVAHVWLAHRRHGAEVVWVPVRNGVIDPEEYRRRIDEDTLLVSACHAYYLTGFKQDLALLARTAHEAGALLYVDAYQSLGTGPVDVKAAGVDLLAAGTLKFLMGMPGIAFLYVSPRVADRLEPTLTGWFARADPFAFDPKRLDWAPGGRRFDTGTPPILEAYVARAGMALLNDLGMEAVGAWTRELSRALVAGGLERGLELVGPRDPDRKAPTTAFRCPGDAHEVEARLRERGILASARGPVIRLAPHVYNTLEEVEAALDALAEILAR